MSVCKGCCTCPRTRQVNIFNSLYVVLIISEENTKKLKEQVASKKYSLLDRVRLTWFLGLAISLPPNFLLSCYIYANRSSSDPFATPLVSVSTYKLTRSSAMSHQFNFNFAPSSAGNINGGQTNGVQVTGGQMNNYDQLNINQSSGGPINEGHTTR